MCQRKKTNGLKLAGNKNDTTILKSIEKPYKPQTRPIVMFQWDIDQNFGVEVSQRKLWNTKALNTELRARVDNLACKTVLLWRWMQPECREVRQKRRFPAVKVFD